MTTIGWTHFCWTVIMGGNDDFTCNFFFSLSLIPSHLLADLSEKRKVRLLCLQSFLWVNVVISGSFISVSVGVDVYAPCGSSVTSCIGLVSTAASAGGRLDFPWVSFRFPWVGYPIPNHGTWWWRTSTVSGPPYRAHRWQSTQCHGLHRRKNGGNHCPKAKLFVNVAPSCHGKKN